MILDYLKSKMNEYQASQMHNVLGEPAKLSAYIEKNFKNIEILVLENAISLHHKGEKLSEKIPGSVCVDYKVPGVEEHLKKNGVISSDDISKGIIIRNGYLNTDIKELLNNMSRRYLGPYELHENGVAEIQKWHATQLANSNDHDWNSLHALALKGLHCEDTPSLKNG